MSRTAGMGRSVGRKLRADVASEIANWVAWCWQGPAVGPPVAWHAGSAEGKYHRKSVMGDEAAPAPPPRVIHAPHARRVQKIYDNLPPTPRTVVWYEYLQRRRFDQWERGQEMDGDGRLREVAVRVANTRRSEARRKLKIDRHRYQQYVDTFCQHVAREFAF